MRDLILFAVVFAILPFGLKRPLFALFLCMVFSLMNPHRLTYGAAYTFPFVAVTLVVALVGLLLSRQPKTVPIKPVTIVLFTFIGWMALTTFLAKEPALAWKEFDRVMKTMFITVIIIMSVRSIKEVKALAWVIALSLGFYGFKGGIFTIASGGTSHVIGPELTYIGDNNALALALVTSTPLIWYFRTYAENKWLKRAMTALAFLTIVSVIGSYSRGALLGLIGMLSFLWLKSRHKMRTALALLLIIPIVYTLMPEKWFQRMDTISEYKQDNSALGRINSWEFAVNVAVDNPTGGGFRVFTPNMFLVYAPNPQIFFDAHSIYFQVLGEHGFIGLGLFLILMTCAWRTGSRIKKKCADKASLRWASDLANLSQVSIIGYALAGAFLTLAYYDLYYFIIALLITLERAIDKETLAEPAVGVVQPVAPKYSVPNKPLLRPPA